MSLTTRALAFASRWFDEATRPRASSNRSSPTGSASGRTHRHRADGTRIAVGSARPSSWRRSCRARESCWRRLPPRGDESRGDAGRAVYTPAVGVAHRSIHTRHADVVVAADSDDSFSRAAGDDGGVPLRDRAGGGCDSESRSAAAAHRARRGHQGRSHRSAADGRVPRLGDAGREPGMAASRGATCLGPLERPPARFREPARGRSRIDHARADQSIRHTRMPVHDQRRSALDAS